MSKNSSKSIAFPAPPWMINTPTHTSTASPSNSAHDKESTASPESSSTFTMNNAVASAPEPGETYMIRECSSERALTLVDGKPTVLLNEGTRGGWHWKCEEHPNGWIGFRNAVSGRYLGRDDNGGYMVEATKFDHWESFVLRPREVGGYNLCVRFRDKLKPMGIVDADGPTPKLVDAKSPDQAARWEFVRV
ncbi:hypothetical protein O1611_g2212 [Lasiodiplodia mahajangana]|uniref:Uncharacterized protein n=1 Tax=Lasiodiplodia mahajangana TaxID=1108764 RepID=A0ACC2JV72_9PEZI|nr:hypothetical protein O1611_g2212 [Lasiodiplodia mahajangana]